MLNKRTADHIENIAWKRFKVMTPEQTKINAAIDMTTLLHNVLSLPVPDIRNVSK